MSRRFRLGEPFRNFGHCGAEWRLLIPPLLPFRLPELCRFSGGSAFPDVRFRQFGTPQLTQADDATGLRPMIAIRPIDRVLFLCSALRRKTSCAEGGARLALR